ncbi:helix-turn-helix transcriptional regulator [Micromonospora sp. RTP1Z1]|uniref:helix-turn-helix domain-containing protein n=1 Tax=Micromonospora sp. RTP1Z1 TaxID=2994043 RepID=UPI0029C9934F|nr:helix-turn-helix transcriptional regulator [Micromonospora sp. RTP1Z1]
MKLSSMKTLDEAVREHRQDAEFRAEWDRTAFARAVATTVTAYRAKQKLTQRALSKLTGLTQPAIARLESGEHEPSLGTLAKLTLATGLTFEVKVSSGCVDLEQVYAPGKSKRAAKLPVPGRGRRVRKDLPEQSSTGAEYAAC